MRTLLSHHRHLISIPTLGPLALAILLSCGAEPRKTARIGPREPVTEAHLYRVYKIRPGDTLSEIARRFRIAGGAEYLALMNRLPDPDRIRSDTILRLPATRQTATHRDLELARKYLFDIKGLCPLTPLPVPTTSAVEACDKAECVTLPQTEATGSRRICFCWGASDEPQARFLVQQQDQHRITSASILSLPPIQYATAFLVFQGDLDADGLPETILAGRNATSNGIAITNWTIAILNGRDLPKRPQAVAAAWIHFKVHDFGRGTFVSLRNSSKCHILAALWDDARDPFRGLGLYLTVRRYRYHRQALQPLPDHPVLLRRYHRSFEKERWATLGNNPHWLFKDAPLTWLKHASAVASPTFSGPRPELGRLPHPK